MPIFKKFVGYCQSTKGSKNRPTTIKGPRQGFTLIELLVVISIIGILATFTIYQFSPASAKARDTRRKEDLNAIMKALYIARSDSANGNYFPNCDAVGNGCLLTETSTNPDISPEYIRVVPIDPKTQTPYLYWPKPSNPAQCNNVGQMCINFQLTACLEYTKDPLAVADATTCPQTGYKYVVSSF